MVIQRLALAVGVLSLLGVVGCGAAGQVGASSGPPSATPGAAAAAQASRAGGSGPLAGTVIGVNGSTLTLKEARGGQTITVHLTGSTAVYRQRELSVAEITAGQPIRAVGVEENDALQARQVQIGSGPARGGFAGPTGPRRTPVGNQRGQVGGAVVVGQVDSVSGNTVSVRTADGSLRRVVLVPNVRISTETPARVSDLVPGAAVVVVGPRAGGTITASAVIIGSGESGGA
ncbi:MAG: hypothetical protein IRY83_08780 [Chloroflexi bacterium]|nr:hypothetical protein [Chloroflexota bacterium]